MEQRVIESGEQVSEAWLTAVLRGSGAVTAGAVAAFDVVEGAGTWSTNARLRLHYAEDALGERPERLFLKMVNADLDDEFFGPSEVTYYTRDYVDVERAPLIRCYDAVYSERLRRYHLLLADVTETHVRALDKPPTLEFGLALAAGLARLHARWWGRDGLQAAGAPIHSANFIRANVRLARPGVAPQLSLVADQLPAGSAGLIEEIYSFHPQLMVDRTGDANGFTLIHGDANPLNIMVPRVGDRPLYLIDRQPFDWSLTTWLGVYDLAYLMVLWFEPPMRQALEVPVLRHYHERLQAHGVNGYRWTQLWDDYRLSLAQCLYIATEWCRGGFDKIDDCKKWQWIWLPELRRTLAAVTQLRAFELWR